MTDSNTIVALTAILGLSAIAGIIYGNRYRKRRRAERLRRRGYKAYNQGRPKLVVPEVPASSVSDNVA